MGNVNLQSLRWFWPESVLTVAVLAMFIQDLVVRRSPRRATSLTVGARPVDYPINSQIAFGRW